MMLYVFCEKFINNILNGFQLTEQTPVHCRNDFVQYSKCNNSKSRQTRVTVHVFCKLSPSASHLCEVSWKYSGLVYIVQIAIFNIYYVQRAATPQVGYPELRFSCSACCLIVLYICEKFHNKISNGFNLQSGHEYMAEMAKFNAQRRITPKVGKPLLRFMCSARCLITVYICVKFCENIWVSISYGVDMNDGSADGWTDRQTLKIS